jgi:hypothetical protein
MNLEVYYLHSCARTSATWLKDSHVLAGVVQAQRILSTAVMYQICEVDDLLPGPYDVREPHVQWAMKSAYNYQWVYSYYLTLCDLAVVINGEYKADNWRVRTRLQSYAGIFPDELFCPPPFLYGVEHIERTTEESYRNYYRAIHAKPGSYRRMIPPFWVRGVRRGPAIIPKAEPLEAFDLSEDPLADLR